MTQMFWWRFEMVVGRLWWWWQGVYCTRRREERSLCELSSVSSRSHNCVCACDTKLSLWNTINQNLSLSELLQRIHLHVYQPHKYPQIFDLSMG
mmetsp:Transcript_11054/g.41215  ORF Transcript_11054/g.41215 Transcript_11054/m.41215 type:complete len:94 (-) Transcript_11054:2185-2466(-)